MDSPFHAETHKKAVSNDTNIRAKKFLRSTRFEWYWKVESFTNKNRRSPLKSSRASKSPNVSAKFHKMGQPNIYSLKHNLPQAENRIIELNT